MIIFSSKAIVTVKWRKVPSTWCIFNFFSHPLYYVYIICFALNRFKDRNSWLCFLLYPTSNLSANPFGFTRVNLESMINLSLSLIPVFKLIIYHLNSYIKSYFFRICVCFLKSKVMDWIKRLLQSGDLLLSFNNLFVSMWKRKLTLVWQDLFSLKEIFIFTVSVRILMLEINF